MDSYPWDTADIIAVFRVIFIIHASVYIYSQRRRLTSYPWDNADIIINLPDHLSSNSKCIHVWPKDDLCKNQRHVTVWTLLRSLPIIHISLSIIFSPSSCRQEIYYTLQHTYWYRLFNGIVTLSNNTFKICIMYTGSIIQP